MGAVDDMAEELTAANDEAIALAEACTDAQWTTTVDGEGWPVGVVLHHIAVGHAQMTAWLGRARRGDDITITAAGIDADNARHAQDFAGVSRAEVVAALRRQGAALAVCIGGLEARELAASVSFGPGGGMAVTPEQLAPVAVRHCRSHLADARAALESETV